MYRNTNNEVNFFKFNKKQYLCLRSKLLRRLQSTAESVKCNCNDTANALDHCSRCTLPYRRPHCLRSSHSWIGRANAQALQRGNYESCIPLLPRAPVGIQLFDTI